MPQQKKNMHSKFDSYDSCMKMLVHCIYVYLHHNQTKKTIDNSIGTDEFNKAKCYSCFDINIGTKSILKFHWNESNAFI